MGLLHFVASEFLSFCPEQLKTSDTLRQNPIGPWRKFFFSVFSLLRTTFKVTALDFHKNLNHSQEFLTIYWNRHRESLLNTD